MKQVLQDLARGQTRVEEAPAPLCAPGRLRIATSVSLISAGTERMLVDFARGSLVGKALQQPARVREAVAKMRTDGVVSTLEAIRAKLDEPLALGYCNVGRVLEVGAGVTGFAVGDRVASNGRHAGVVVVPPTLCARIPDNVADEAAAFAVLGAVALQGARLAEPTLGESFAVTGLGLVGLLAVQLLRANGCRVLALDTDATRLALARDLGAETVDLAAGEDPVARALAFSRGRGVDGVLLTLSSRSSEPVSQAARMCRRRGRMVLVGVAGLDLDRADFYDKEISFQVSCSYGPGRYDPAYEEGGQDYPVGFVRWTEQRNFEAVLDMMAAGVLQTAPLVSHRFDVDEAARAYDVLAGAQGSLGILLTYPESARGAASRVVLRPAPTAACGRAVAAFIGAGNYGGRVLISAFRAAGAELDTVVSASGVTAAHQARKAGFRQAASDPQAALDGPANLVCIATRHDSHAALVRRALAAGKHVFVEKPLALSLSDLADIEAALAVSPGMIMVGFNRRFSPLTVRAKALLGALAEPKAFVMTINAGAIANGSWVQDSAVGGGRLVGEACHFIDLIRHLAGAPIIGFDVSALKRPGGPPRADNAVITLRFADGSIGAIHYLANGHKAVAKERLEVFAAGRVLTIDNFLSLHGHGWPGFKTQRLWRQDKGQGACARAFVEAVKAGGPAPIPAPELLEVSRTAIEIADRAD